jgi:hypothetical protein
MSPIALDGFPEREEDPCLVIKDYFVHKRRLAGLRGAPAPGEVNQQAL